MPVFVILNDDNFTIEIPAVDKLPSSAACFLLSSSVEILATFVNVALFVTSFSGFSSSPILQL